MKFHNPRARNPYTRSSLSPPAWNLPETARLTPTLSHIVFNTAENRSFEPTEPPIEENPTLLLELWLEENPTYTPPLGTRVLKQFMFVTSPRGTRVLKHLWVLKAQSFLHEVRRSTSCSLWVVVPMCTMVEVC